MTVYTVKMRLPASDHPKGCLCDQGQIKANRLVALVDQIKHCFARHAAGAVDVIGLFRGVTYRQ